MHCTEGSAGTIQQSVKSQSAFGKAGKQVAGLRDKPSRVVPRLAQAPLIGTQTMIYSA